MSSAAKTLEDDFLSALRDVLGTSSRVISLHEPEFLGREWELVKDCLDSSFVSSVGEYVGQFEAMLADYTGAAHAIALVNGTAALELSLRLAGVRPNDEVIVPALSFVASANAVSHCGALPHFVDSNLETMGLDPAALEFHLSRDAEPTIDGLRNKTTGRRIAAIVPMHTFGHPIAIDELCEIAQRLGIAVVEDAAEGIGSFYRGRHVGTFGLLGALSFNGNKTITTGGGGAILTDNPRLARRAKHLATTAKVSHRWEFNHDEVAWNFRMPNINAALGCAQMERLPQMLDAKRRLAARYRQIFSRVEGLDFVAEPKGTRSNYWLNTVFINQSDFTIRDRLLTAANDAGFQCRPVWTLLSNLPMYVDMPSAPIPVARQLEAALINIPSSARLGLFPE